jgi:Ca-activated chloride channel homolog
MRASVRFDHELLAVEHDHDASCMLELTAPPAPTTTDRRPLALVLVIDRSGSMRGDKLDVTRRSASFLVERLAVSDRLGIVSFDDEVRLEAPLLEVGPNRAALLGAIAAITPGGQTNLSGGWLKGVELLAPLDDSFTRRALLLTDGMANVGIVEDLQLAKMARASAGDGIGTSTIGFGAGFSEDLLTSMAEAGNGGAYFAEGPDSAPTIFAAEFEDLLSLVAQNVSVEIRPGWGDVDLLSILNDFPQVPVEGGVQLQLGDAYGDEHRRIVFQLRVPSLAALGPTKIAEVIIRYVALGEQVAMHEVTVPLIVNAVSADDAAASLPDAEVVEEVVILLGARAQEEARELADMGDYDGARSKLTDAANELRARATGSARAGELIAQADSWERRAGTLAPESWLMDRKRMTYENRRIKERRDRPRPGQE